MWARLRQKHDRDQENKSAKIQWDKVCLLMYPTEVGERGKQDSITSCNISQAKGSLFNSPSHLVCPLLLERTSVKKTFLFHGTTILICFSFLLKQNLKSLQVSPMFLFYRYPRFLKVSTQPVCSGNVPQPKIPLRYDHERQQTFTFFKLFP